MVALSRRQPGFLTRAGYVSVDLGPPVPLDMLAQEWRQAGDHEELQPVAG
ncbi:hypothetical protein ACLESD_06185 [Pyxidicoccus sp. 3LFB2]